MGCRMYQPEEKVKFFTDEHSSLLLIRKKKKVWHLAEKYLSVMFAWNDCLSIQCWLIMTGHNDLTFFVTNSFACSTKLFIYSKQVKASAVSWRQCYEANSTVIYCRLRLTYHSNFYKFEFTTGMYYKTFYGRNLRNFVIS